MSLSGKYSFGVLLAFVLLALVMLYAFPVVSFFTGIKGFSAYSFFLSRIILWIILIIILLYSFFIEKGPFLLKKEKEYPAAFYGKAVSCLYLICVAGAAFLNFLLHIVAYEETSDKLIQFSSVLKNNYFLIIFTCFTAGIMEELLMRGYIQPRLEKIYNSPHTGIIGSALLFGILHSTYGIIGQVMVTSFIGIIFAMFYKLYSNIKVLILCHFLIDFISLMIMNFIDFKHLSVF